MDAVSLVGWERDCGHSWEICRNQGPFLELLLPQLRDQGVRRVVLCIGHRGEVVRRYFGRGQCWGMSICYSHEKTWH